MSTPDRIRRLPKWAQEHIADLKRKLAFTGEVNHWEENGVEWDMLIHPSLRGPEVRGQQGKLYIKYSDGAVKYRVGDVGPNDMLFLGRKTQGGAE